MAARRTRQELEQLERVSRTTYGIAREIEDRINPEDDGANLTDQEFIRVSGGEYHHAAAPWQLDAAQGIKVSYYTKEPNVAEAVAKAIRAELDRILARTCSTCIQLKIPAEIRACCRCKDGIKDLYSEDLSLRKG